MATETVFFGKLLQSADLLKAYRTLKSPKAQMLNPVRGSSQLLEPEAGVNVHDTLN